jgi:hypothetical protein
MELSTTLKCECNDKLYASAASLKTHKKTNMHMVWALHNEVRDLEIRATRLDNENLNLKRLNNILLEKIYDKQEQKVN